VTIWNRMKQFGILARENFDREASIVARGF
jgi:hypothetical protein